MIEGMRAAFVAAALVALAACADTSEPQPAHVEGLWHYSEELSDNLRGLVCTDTGSYRFRQAGATFTGEYFQVGVCLASAGGGFFNTDSGRLSAGLIVGHTLTFDATPMCRYEGRLSGAPPASVSGRGYCTLTINGTVHNFEGSWEATRTTTVP